MTPHEDPRLEFAARVRPHLEALYRLAYRLTGRSEDAEDLLQELLLRLYRNPGELARVEALRPWLVRSLHNLFVDQWRRWRRSPFGHLHPEPWEELLVNRPGGDPPDQQAQAAELRRAVLAALYRLSKEHRALLVLHDMEGRTLPELAELLHLPLGTLKSRLFRARRKLRRALEARNPLAHSGVETKEDSGYEL